ncbi:hypothetical protein [Nonomuraea jiangxiensis]|uniref:Uncharacterized protein n=1 Tax=Nonomuraea jiangxiensis TaxID=633440 RepID=A0A1G8IID3_9ACTN|nr:hypothetical protein [Nonomuraea jiangxiensis]SDI18665.1 hypothetical protein SAMN05421869_104501 [Nonomuraea jiangxiensis]
MTEVAAAPAVEQSNPVETGMAAWARAVQQLGAHWSLAQSSSSEVVEAARHATTAMTEAALNTNFELTDEEALNEDLILARLAEETLRSDPWLAAMTVFGAR